MENCFQKYIKIPHLEEVLSILDNPVEVYEKIDGGNVQIRKTQGRVLCGSRAHYITREEHFRFPWFKNFQKWALGNYSFYSLPEDLIVFGEWSAKHTLDYKPEFTDRFFLTDIFDLQQKKFIPYNEGKKKLVEIGIKEIIFLKTLLSDYTTKEKLEKMVSDSDYREGDKEGLVIKNYTTQKFAKLWTRFVRLKKGIITQPDIKSISLSLIDAGEDVTKGRLMEEILKDFNGGRRNVPVDKIETEVDRFFDTASKK